MHKMFAAKKNPAKTTKTKKGVEKVVESVSVKKESFNDLVDKLHANDHKTAAVEATKPEVVKDKVKSKKQDKVEAVKSEPKSANFLDTAKDLVNDDREKLYGHPYDNWSDISLMWSVILGVDVTPQQAVLCMIAMKISREKHLEKADNMIDIAGYVHVYEKVLEKTKEVSAAKTEMFNKMVTQIQQGK